MKKLITTAKKNYSKEDYDSLVKQMKNNFQFEDIRFKEIFTNPDYFKKNKNDLVAALVYLSPSEYMDAVELCQKEHTFSQDKLDSIRDFRDAGNKFEPPFLIYGYRDLHNDDEKPYFSQEGYNRAYYMQMMGLKEIPVFVRYRENDTNIPSFLREKLEIEIQGYKMETELKEREIESTLSTSSIVEIVQAMLKQESFNEITCGDTWINIDLPEYKHGVFVQVESKELEDGNYSDDIYCFYGYKNIIDLKTKELTSDYSSMVFFHEVNKSDIKKIFEEKKMQEDFEKVFVKNTIQNIRMKQ